MKKLYFMAVAIVCLMASCSQNDMFEQEFRPTLNATGEVLFSAATNEGTRTEYDHNSYDATSGSIAVKWLDGDLITVYGTNCAAGRSQAIYKVEPSATAGGTTAADRFYYADKLTSTGSYGVQWGKADDKGVVKSDFYAVYPSTNGTIKPTDAGDGVVAPVSIAYQQYNNFSVNGNTIQGTPYNPVTKANGMNDAIMYACTTDAVAETDSDGNPKAVDLKFKPYSTVLKFTIPSWTAKTGSDLATNVNGKKLTVTTITLTAPEGVKIAGDFNLTINDDGTATASSGTANTIAVLPMTSTIEWEYGKSLEFSIFTIPMSEVELNKDWTVTIGIQNDNARKVSLKPSTTTATFAPGKIHNLKLSKGFVVEGVWTYSMDTWMTTVPRNVYISDISLPGAWYATDSGYQGGSLEEQFKAGIRAFNIDCRLTLKVGENVNNHGSSSVYADKESDATDGTLVLACTGTEEHSFTGWSPKITSIGKTVKQALIELGKLMTEDGGGHPDEYIEVIISVAQKVKDNNYLTANHAYFGTVNAKMMMAAIAQVLNDSEVKQYLYGGKAGEAITPETTLGDVKGKLVVKVNANTSATNLTSWTYNAPMLVSEGSMATSADSNKHITIGNFTAHNSPVMYWAGTDAGYSNPTMTYHYHQAQNTTGSSPYPTVANRQTAINSIVDESYSIYSKNTHDAMFQLGIGGWTADNDNGKTNLSSQLKPYVKTIVDEMIAGTRTPAPVGAVLMNHATAGSTHNTADLIKAIVDLNGKYFLNRDTSKPAWDVIPDAGGGEGDQVSDNGGNGNEGGQGTV